MKIETTFDYIIIGGGSAGCVLANRLTADGKHQVCLLEAGPSDSNPLIHMPLGIVMLLRSKKLNWQYFTEPQAQCGNRAIYWPRGRMLGGSSSINAMCYIRGYPQDFDKWAELGNDGWAYKDVLPYFKKLEHFETGPDHNHGVDGPLNITLPRDPNPLMKTFIEAGKQAGYPVVNDFNYDTPNGVGYFHITQKDGQRYSNARAYLHAAQQRNNLTTITKAHVVKILFHGKKAIGVRYKRNGHYYDIFTSKEVLLSAGAIGSPHLLLLSGVGPTAELTKHNIPVVQDLPGVGENLQDHLGFHITCLEKTRLAISFHIRSWWRFVVDAYRYVFQRRGTLTSNYTQAGGFFKSDEQLSTPDMQWHFAPSIYTHSARELKNIFKYYGYTLMACLLNPASRGYIRLKNTNPFAAPIIEPNYLTAQSDLDAMVLGFKKTRKVLQQAAFNQHCLREFEPGDTVQTDEQIRQYIQQNAETTYHPVGTCKMGRDNMAVVDPLTLKVHGIENLRVIDASIMPTLISGNTNTATTMIAEKAADIILRGL
jgi:choline dehydrogenase-like flavoprotein